MTDTNAAPPLAAADPAPETAHHWIEPQDPLLDQFSFKYCAVCMVAWNHVLAEKPCKGRPNVTLGRETAADPAPEASLPGLVAHIVRMQSDCNYCGSHAMAEILGELAREAYNYEAARLRAEDRVKVLEAQLLAAWTLFSDEGYGEEFIEKHIGKVEGI